MEGKRGGPIRAPRRIRGTAKKQRLRAHEGAKPFRQWRIRSRIHIQPDDAKGSHMWRPVSCRAHPEARCVCGMYHAVRRRADARRQHTHSCIMYGTSRHAHRNVQRREVKKGQPGSVPRLPGAARFATSSFLSSLMHATQGRGRGICAVTRGKVRPPTTSPPVLSKGGRGTRRKSALTRPPPPTPRVRRGRRPLRSCRTGTGWPSACSGSRCGARSRSTAGACTA